MAENAPGGRGGCGHLRHPLQRAAELRCVCRFALLRADDNWNICAANKTAGRRASVSSLRVSVCSCTLYSGGGGDHGGGSALPHAKPREKAGKFFFLGFQPFFCGGGGW